jgi:hypothetical protein
MAPSVLLFESANPFSLASKLEDTETSASATHADRHAKTRFSPVSRLDRAATFPIPMSLTQRPARANRC